MSDGTKITQERAARNQSIFREVNEQLEGLDDQLSAQEHHPFVCECAGEDCLRPIEVSLDEYESVRSRGSTFAVAPGHVYPEVERILESNDRFTVVEKVEAAAEVAEAHFARSSA